ncbi:uncharacterized protein MONBRDRAFT_7999 [Monosiga brevicollis MX1]|uniref:Uncharacterized protein n=1 Tax=Monosiga brevicollis TaxID=81824 RepID=A9UYQ9_MONBE|nr:uncharacterized protein MONBRDRAFT_7999 [Monosiga brevicollis MX1]EDQ89649.1 predicted protein [Monosiga brevicollis MX1]|eukprot:XP_001745678.1 hypothetical protein [Monosiga brevicollis MX1]
MAAATSYPRSTDSVERELKLDAIVFGFRAPEQAADPERMAMGSLKEILQRGFDHGLHLRETTSVKVLDCKRLGADALAVIDSKRLLQHGIMPCLYHDQRHAIKRVAHLGPRSHRSGQRHGWWGLFFDILSQYVQDMAEDPTTSNSSTRKQQQRIEGRRQLWNSIRHLMQKMLSERQRVLGARSALSQEWTRQPRDQDEQGRIPISEDNSLLQTEAAGVAANHHEATEAAAAVSSRVQRNSDLDETTNTPGHTAATGTRSFTRSAHSSESPSTADTARSADDHTQENSRRMEAQASAHRTGQNHAGMQASSATPGVLNGLYGTLAAFQHEGGNASSSAQNQIMTELYRMKADVAVIQADVSSIKQQLLLLVQSLQQQQPRMSQHS